MKKEQFLFFSLWFFLPLLLLLFYTGNYGFFSSYYFIPQFAVAIIFLSAFLVWLSKRRLVFVSFLVGAMVAVSVMHYEGVWDFKNSQFNISRMRSAIGFVYYQTGDLRPITSIFVANGQTEHYDYLFDEFARKNRKPTHINLSPQDLRQQDHFFLLYETHGLGENLLKSRFEPWYREATESSRLIEKDQFGIIHVERRQRLQNLTSQS